MARQTRIQDPDQAVRSIMDALESHHQPFHTEAGLRSYRRNSASIRIRIIDPDFQGVDRVSRDDQVWEILGHLSEDVQSQITMVLLLTPEEAETSFANMEFENPIPTRR